MNITMLYYFLSFHFILSQTSVYLASRKGVGGNPGTIFLGLRRKSGGEIGERGKGLAGIWVGSCFTGFGMPRQR